MDYKMFALCLVLSPWEECFFVIVFGEILFGCLGEGQTKSCGEDRVGMCVLLFMSGPAFGALVDWAVVL